ncbi:MAG TPA: glycoside hydrolase family 9 protein, partial [Chitinophagaceae bacterium]|nr:glycoside hydrolase family 9 protein [Chitinophagaceae bacterium]
MRLFSVFIFINILVGSHHALAQSWIRINQLGYPANGTKVAVWVSKEMSMPDSFVLKEAKSNHIVFASGTGKSYGAYGPFNASARLSFTSFAKPGHYFIACGDAVSPVLTIGDEVYDGAADFSLRYLRQQRSGFNPFLKDSCHTGDGYTMYGPMPDSTHIDVSGGWHDATDYLQYITTSANATYHLLAAYRDFGNVFSDQHAANGLAGTNGVADVLDEARWGLQWLLKMHPQKDWLFTQLADDRDHAGFRLPNHDSVDYGLGKGRSRPVYFATGQPQGLGKYKNNSTGLASAAGKFASAFALGARVYKTTDTGFAHLLTTKALSAYQLGINKPGVTQTAPNREPYFYEEENWADDMELAAANLYRLTERPAYFEQSLQYGAAEKYTPWMGADTAKHYQWYPFHNFGHYELAKQSDKKTRAMLAGYYKMGIDRVWKKAQGNAFYRGVPFIWCSNNLTVAFGIQCYLYRKLSGDQQYRELEQACIDWLLGCNPWGKSMIYGLPANGNTPLHPHSSLSLLNHYDLDGAMVDGPIAGSIYNNLRGLKLYNDDAYAQYQSAVAVYHDDAGDYSTNEPTTDGTASLVYLLAAAQSMAHAAPPLAGMMYDHGAIVRGDTASKKLALVFTGDEFADGGAFIAKSLQEAGVKASFFLTGRFYRTKLFAPVINKLQQEGHYLGVHSDKHLLYCDWSRRDSLLVTKKTFTNDLLQAYKELKKRGITTARAGVFLPPYEWYNDSIAAWTKNLGLQLVSFTPGTRSNADYTYP